MEPIEAVTGVTQYLFTQGVLGVLVIAEALFIYWQFKRIDKKDIQIEELQDKRVADSVLEKNGYVAITKESINAGRDVANGLQLVNKSVEGIASLIERWMQPK